MRREIEKNNPVFRVIFLATVFKNWMFSFVAVFMIIVAVLFRDNFHLYFSCHGIIIAYFSEK